MFGQLLSPSSPSSEVSIRQVPARLAAALAVPCYPLHFLPPLHLPALAARRATPVSCQPVSGSCQCSAVGGITCDCRRTADNSSLHRSMARAWQRGRHVIPSIPHYYTHAQGRTCTCAIRLCTYRSGTALKTYPLWRMTLRSPWTMDDGREEARPYHSIELGPGRCW